jgi:hypothetical protein
MAFDDSFERKKLVEDLKLIMEDPYWPRIAIGRQREYRNRVLAIYTKHLEIILNALSNAKERKFSDIDTRGLSYLAHLKAFEAIQPMIEKLIEDSNSSIVAQLMYDFSDRIISHIMEIGEGWREAGSCK